MIEDAIEEMEEVLVLPISDEDFLGDDPVEFLGVVSASSSTRYRGGC